MFGCLIGYDLTINNICDGYMYSETRVNSSYNVIFVDADLVMLLVWMQFNRILPSHHV